MLYVIVKNDIFGNISNLHPRFGYDVPKIFPDGLSYIRKKYYYENINFFVQTFMFTPIFIYVRYGASSKRHVNL